MSRGSGAPLVLQHGNGSMIQDFESSGLIDLASKNYRKGLREGAKADLAATSLGGALKFCIEATGVVDLSTMPEVEKWPCNICRTFAATEIVNSLRHKIRFTACEPIKFAA